MSYPTVIASDEYERARQVIEANIVEEKKIIARLASYFRTFQCNHFHVIFRYTLETYGPVVLAVIKEKARFYCEACTPPYSWACRRRNKSQCHSCKDPASMILRNNKEDIISSATTFSPQAYEQVCEAS